MLELWTYRQLVWDAALSDLRYRYAGSGLGVFWNVITPLAMLAIFTFVFTSMLTTRFASIGMPAGLFPLYLGSGFLTWVAFVDCVTRGANALLTNAVYLKKMPIPEQVFVAQTAVTATLGMLIAVGLLLGLAILLGQMPTWTWLLLPVVVVIWQAFGFGLGLILSTLTVFFRDLAQVLGVVMQLWMWSVPVVYLEQLLPTEYQRLLPYNPAYPFLTAVHDIYLYGVLPPAWAWLAMIGWTLVVIALGALLLARLRPEIRDML